MNTSKPVKQFRVYFIILIILSAIWLTLSHKSEAIEAANLVPDDLADFAEAITVDDTGAIYVVGKTTSTGFPVVAPFQETYGGGESDGFIAVLAPDGQSLQYSTYIGGGGMDIITDIAISDAGRIVVTGATGSADFPLANPYQSNLNAVDGFVMVFEPNFLSLVYSTYIGGNDWEYPRNLAVDAAGSVHITGYTHSANFPLVNPIQTYQGQNDVFVTGFAPGGQALAYSTVLGGSGNEEAYEIVLDANGRKYVTGYTESSDFPTANAYQPTLNGFRDSFVTVLNEDSQSLEMSTFLGGNLSDASKTIKIDSNNRIYLGGYTESSDFPTANPYQPAKSVGIDGFISVFSEDGSSLVYSTFLGGNQGDTVWNITLDNLGRIFVLGYAYSTDFPLANPLQSSNKGSTDIFLTAFEADGQSLFYSTYLGGSGGDVGYSLTLDNNGLAYLAGTTWSDNFPVMNPYQSDITGYVDGLVSVLSADGQSLQYSTYLGSSYPSPTDVTLNELRGSSSAESGSLPSWAWLALALLVFFGATLLMGKFIGQQKK